MPDRCTAGLLKKAHELAVLCGCEMMLVIIAEHNGQEQMYEFASHPMPSLIAKYTAFSGPRHVVCNVVFDEVCDSCGFWL